jgi:hypothetical protein
LLTCCSGTKPAKLNKHSKQRRLEVGTCLE